MSRIVLGTVLLAAATLAAGESGDLVTAFRIMVTTGPGADKPITLKEYVAEDALRIELEDPWETAPEYRKMTIVMARESSRTLRKKATPSEQDKLYMYLIDDENHKYQVWDAKIFFTDAGKTSLNEAGTYTVRKLGNDRVANVPCQKVLLTSPKGDRTELCVARELSEFAEVLLFFKPNGRGMTFAFRGADDPWIKALRRKGIEGCPIRYAFRVGDSAVTAELTYLDRKPLPRALFQIPLGYRQTLFPMSAGAPGAPEKMAPEQRKTWRAFKLAEQALILDHEIALIEPPLGAGDTTIHTGDATISPENAADILERMQRERHEVDVEIDKEGFATVGGAYSFEAAVQEDCRLKELPTIVSEPVTILQDGHRVELKGKTLKGCGVIVGNSLFLRNGCSTSEPVALLVEVQFEPNRAVQVSIYDPYVIDACSIGTLKKRAVMVPSDQATLFVSCSTASTVWVDGKLLGSCTPGQALTLSLTPGKHTFRAETADSPKSSWLEIVDVAADAFTTLRLDKGGKTAIKVDKR
jgi:hypothetical protein